MLNPNAHRAFGLEFEQMDDLMNNSPKLVGELQLIDMCSQSDGACAVIFACEEKAKKLSKKPVWVRDHITVHREETFNIFGYDEKYPGAHDAPVRGGRTCTSATESKSRSNISTCSRCTIPASWWGVDWLRDFFQLKGDEHLQARGEQGDHDRREDAHQSVRRRDRVQPDRRHGPRSGGRGGAAGTGRRGRAPDTRPQ